MSGKQLDENSIVNELKGSSLFFQTKEGSAFPQTAPKDVSTASVVPLPASPQSKTTLHPSSPPPSLQEPSQSPTVPVTLVTAPAYEFPSMQNSSSAPTVPDATQIPATGDGTMVGLDERRNVRTSERRKV